MPLVLLDPKDATAANKLWVEQWQRVGPLLEKFRHEELRAMTEQDAAEACQMLFDFAFHLPEQDVRTTSGLVEQQRVFLKLRKP